MCVVVCELAKLRSRCADIRAGYVVSDSVIAEVVLEPIVLGSRGVVTYQLIVWVGNPESSRGHVGVKSRPRLDGHHSKVRFEPISTFNTSLKEESVPHDVEGNVLRDWHVVGAVKSNSAVVAVADRASLYV